MSRRTEVSTGGRYSIRIRASSLQPPRAVSDRARPGVDPPPGQRGGVLRFKCSLSAVQVRFKCDLFFLNHSQITFSQLSQLRSISSQLRSISSQLRSISSCDCGHWEGPWGILSLQFVLQVREQKASSESETWLHLGRSFCLSLFPLYQSKVCG